LCEPTVACKFPCATCEHSESSCLSCVVGKNREINETSKTCPCTKNYFENDDKDCKKCDPTCDTCKGPLSD